MSRSRVAGSCGNVMFNFLRNHQTSMAAEPFYTPTSNVQGFPHPHPCQHWLFSFLKIFSHPSGCEVVSHCGFNLHLANDQFEHPFMVLLATICRSSLEKQLFKSFVHFIIGLFVFLFHILF